MHGFPVHTCAPPADDDFIRAGRQAADVKCDPERPDAEPAQLDMHIAAGRPLADPTAPFSEHLVALAGIAAEADRAADMVEHDLRLGKGARQLDQLAELRVIHPRVEAET